MITLFFILQCAGGTQRDGMLYQGGLKISDKKEWNIKQSEFEDLIGEPTGVAPVYAPRVFWQKRKFGTELKDYTCSTVQEECVKNVLSSISRFRFSGATPDFLQPSEFYPGIFEWMCKCSVFFIRVIDLVFQVLSTVYQV